MPVTQPVHRLDREVAEPANDTLPRHRAVPDTENRRLEVLRELGLLEADDDQLFDRLAELTRHMLSADTALVSLVTEDRQIFRGQAGVRPDLAGERGSGLEYSYCKYAVATDEPLVVSDARESLLLRDSPAITDRNAVAYAGVPLSVDGGAVLGTLCVIHGSARNWSDEELQRLEHLAALAKVELERRLQRRRMQEILVLAERMEGPVERLGDTVRTAATLAEQPGDPRLPRVADQARHRLHSVETLTHDLTAAVRRERTPADQSTVVDVAALLHRTVALAGSAARPGDFDAEVPDHPVVVTASPVALSRGLTLAVTTMLHHARGGETVVLRLVETEHDGRVTVTVESGGVLAAPEVLRIAGHFRAADGQELPLDVRYAGASLRVRNEVIQATSGGGRTRFEVALQPHREEG